MNEFLDRLLESTLRRTVLYSSHLFILLMITAILEVLLSICTFDLKVSL